MKATVSISTANVDELRTILALLNPVAPPEGLDVSIELDPEQVAARAAAMRQGYFHFPALEKLMALGEEPEADDSAGHATVREFAPIEVKARHLEVIQRLKKGKATARQLTPKLRGHWTQQEVSNSLAYLKRMGLVERQVGSRYWVATPKAKAHLLVAA